MSCPANGKRGRLSGARCRAARARPCGFPAAGYSAPLADMKRAAASTAARNNGPGGDSAAGASPLTTVEHTAWPRCLIRDNGSSRGR